MTDNLRYTQSKGKINSSGIPLKVGDMRGFGLIWVLIILAILGILAAVIVPRLLGW